MSGEVRICGGALRGRALHVPRGVRPSSARLREALFSIWHERVPGARFLDLFAGSGAVGLEAASRGAAAVALIDADPLALRALARNAHLASPLAARVEVRRARLPEGLGELAAAGLAGAALVFADPPYRFAAYMALVAGVEPLLAAAGELAVEHASRAEPPAAAGGLVRVDRRRYGETSVTFYRRTASA